MKDYKCKKCKKDIRMSEMMFDKCKACDYDDRVKPLLDEKINTTQNCNSYVKWWIVYDCICWKCF